MFLSADFSNLVGAAFLVIVGGFLYFLPTIVAANRHTVNAGGVFVLNLLLGWTFIGWVVALAMAAGGMTKGQLGLRQEPAQPQFSADRQWWWNGREWVPSGRNLPPGP